MRIIASAGLAAVGLAILAVQPASAASLVICDSELCGSPDNNITFSMNDFEGGFQINSVTRQFGLSSPAQFVISEDAGGGVPAQIDFSGAWILGGSITPVNETIFFTEGLDGGISDVLHYTYSQDVNGFGHLDGFVMSDVTGVIDPAFLEGLNIEATQTLPEDGVYRFNNTNITASFESDPAEVPEPATLGLLGISLAGLGLARRRRRAG